MSLTPFGSAANEFFQLVEILLIQDFRFHHATDQFFHRTAAEAVDDVSHGARREASSRLDRMIYIRAALLFVTQVALLFETAKDRAGAGFFKVAGARDFFVDGLDRRRAEPPNYLHDLVFEA
jgi:hypothetical protein